MGSGKSDSSRTRHNVGSVSNAAIVVSKKKKKKKGGGGLEGKTL